MIAKKTRNRRNLRPRKHDWASALLSLSESRLGGLKKREAMVRAAQQVLGRLGTPATMVALDAHMPKILTQGAVYRDGDEGCELGRANAMARTCSARKLHRWITLYREHGPIGLVDGRPRLDPVDRSVEKAARMPSLTNASQPGGSASPKNGKSSPCPRGS